MKKTIYISIISSVVASMIVVLLMGLILPNKLNVGKDYYFVGGVIRNVGNGWNLISDIGHEAININKVETTDDSIILHYQKASKVVTFNVTPDETMTSEGHTMGASVGFDKTIINVFDKDHKLINPKTYINSKGNIWVNGIFKN